MAIITPGMGAKEITDNRKRGAYGHEYNVKAGVASDQTAALDNLLDAVVLPVGGRDYAPYVFPSGKIELQTPWVISKARGVKFIGQGRTRNNTAPRNHGGSANMSGTDLYWAGAAGGTAIEVRETNFAVFEDFALYLGSAAGQNHAALGVHWSNPSLFGHGRNVMQRCAITAFDHGGVGMQFGTASGDLNVDTFILLGVQFYELATCCVWKHSQGLEWSFFAPQVTNCDTWFHFENGGNFYIFGLQSEEHRSTGVNDVIIKVDTATNNQGNYHIYGGYCDRAGDNARVTVFETSNNVVNTVMSAYGLNIRPIGVGSLDFTGATKGFVEAYGGSMSYVLSDGKYYSQPVVRWRTAAANSYRGHVKVRNCIVHDGRQWGSELVTCNEGGWCGEVVFEDCSQVNSRKFESVTVNRFPIHGNRRTHVDIDNFDATDWAASTWSNSWLGGGKTSSPAWAGNLAAYYPFHENLGAILAVDKVNTGALDLTIDADMQVSDPPMPYLGQWCDFNLSDSTHGRDTGVAVSPATQDLTFFGYIEIDEVIASGRTAFAVNTSGDVDFAVCVTTGTGGQVRIGRIGGGPVIIEDMRPYQPEFWVWTVDASADTWQLYINGCLKMSQTFAGYAATAAGTAYIGGRNTTIRTNWCGKLSRCGVIKQHLTAKQATILSMQAATCAERRFFNP